MNTLLSVIFLSFSLSAQNHLDELFDNGDKESRFHIGADLMIITKGTYSPYYDLRLTENITIHRF